ncbi:MAG: 5-formyltetrahydrofolate cyclo-ligase [Candidatus Thermoplasmatota archaeon]|nr:5-formyltetrahydrofolate cyclo-ligase [Candidatus Thermoplasmatota archaeon]
MNKKELRNHLISLRKQESKQFIFENSEKISNNLLILPAFFNSSHILLYVSYNGEVCTHNLIKKAFSLNKKVYVPISETKNHTLTISKLQQYNDLVPGTYGILEPKKEKRNSVPPKRMETIIVPGVGFDQKGHRLGQGGGYYDWLLTHINATSIGLAFEFQIQNTIPVEPHDQKVDCIVTEKRVIDCNQ